MSFKDWWTNENNPKLPKSEYLYNARHIIVLVITVLLCVALTLLFYKRSEKAKRILFYVLGAIFLFFEILSRIVNLCVTNNYSWQHILEILLPMHICSVMVWVLIIGVFTRTQFLFNFGAIGGLLATLAFLLYPAVGLNREYMSFTCIYSTFSHMLGFVTSVILMTLGVAKFEMKKIWQPYVCFAVMFTWGAFIDFVLLPGTKENYMYIMQDPLELNLPFPYQILYVAILAVYVFIFYFVSWLVKKIKANRKKKKSVQEE